MNTKDMINILLAYQEGKTIQVYNHNTHAWSDRTSHNFNFGMYKFRVKPEPVVVYMNEASSGCKYYYAHECDAIQVAAAETTNYKRTAVKLVEETNEY